MPHFKRPLSGISRLSDRIGGGGAYTSDFTFVAKRDGSIATVSSAPTGTADDDTMIFLAGDGGTNAIVPSGFDQLYADLTGQSLTISFKRASSESGSYTGTNADATAMATFRSASASKFITNPVFDAIPFASTDTISVPVITPAFTGTLLFAAYMNPNNKTVDTAPSGWTELINTAASNNKRLTLYSLAVTKDVDTSATSLVYDSSGDCTGVIFLI